MMDIKCSLHVLPWLAATVLVCGMTANLDAESWAERLGYPPGKRVLILHADDVGMCYEANQAAKAYLEAGQIQSAAAMVPCPWFNEFASWARAHPELDIGIHLTLTSEWKEYRWGPVSPRPEVPGLVDSDGYLHQTVRQVVTQASPAEVEVELRAQIERALKKGLRIGHIDTHMGTVYARGDYTRVYLRLAEEYGIPAMTIEMTPAVITHFRAEGYPLTDADLQLLAAYKLPKLDGFLSVESGDSYEEKKQNFMKMVRALPPGITEIIFHPSIETEGLRRITGSWQQRSWEARLFRDPQVREFFLREGLLFTNWKEMLRRFRQKGIGSTGNSDSQAGQRPEKDR